MNGVITFLATWYGAVIVHLVVGYEPPVPWLGLIPVYLAVQPHSLNAGERLLPFKLYITAISAEDGLN